MSERPSVAELRAAADVLERWCSLPDSHFIRHSPAQILSYANALEAEEAAAKAEEQLVEDVARVIYDSDGNQYGWPESPGTVADDYRGNARALLAEFVITRREDK